MIQTPIHVTNATENDVGDLIADIKSAGHCEIELITSKGFDGVAEITLLLSALGGPLIVKNVAAVIIAWIKKNEKRSVTIGKTKITGYSATDVERILASNDKK